MNRQTRPTASALSALLENLGRELDAVRALRDAVALQRAAVERADPAALRRAAEAVRERSMTLADLGRSRERSIVAIGASAGSALERVVEHVRSQGSNADALERIGAILRTEATEVSRSVAIVRHAAERLSAHLSGVRATVTAPATGLYGRRGRVAGLDRAVAVDLRH